MRDKQSIDDFARVFARLKKRMQGKACFNFTAIDEPLFAELAGLTARGLKAFATIGLA